MSFMYTLFLFFVQILILVPISGAKISAIIVFGDSTVDSGNNNYVGTIARANFGPYGRDFPGGVPTGRFCNGRLSPDFVSEIVGLKPTVPAYLDPMYNISDFATGVCFASAATGFDNVTADVLGVIPLWKEVEYYKDFRKKLREYLGIEKANEIIREALYVVSIGTNDFIENYFTSPLRRSQFTVEQYQDFLVGIAENFFKQLYHLGARKISFTGISPMGCLPSERSANFQDFFGCNEEYNKVALDFNRNLKNLVAKLNDELPGIRVVFAEIYDFVSELIREPSKFGFEVVEVGCCGTGTLETSFLCNQHNPFTCTDADKYVFWDSVHPSEKTNKIISDYLLVKYLKIFL